MKQLLEADYNELVRKATEFERLDALINTPELVDFSRAVHLEAVHQEVRWGTADRESKSPADWYRLVTHLSTRALEHHKEAERLAEELALQPETVQKFGADQVAHHREKAVHHCITTAAALEHWHASMLGKHTTLRPGYATPPEAQPA